jgi:hypothetical protein
MVRLFGEQNPVCGVPGPFKIEGLGVWQAEIGPSKGVLSSSPFLEAGVGRTTSASCWQQLAQTQAQAMKWLPAVHQSDTENPACLLGQGDGWGLWLLLPPAGDLAASPFLRVTGSSERKMGPQPPRGQLHPCSRPQSSTKKLAGSIFLSQQPMRC